METSRPHTARPKLGYHRRPDRARTDLRRCRTPSDRRWIMASSRARYRRLSRIWPSTRASPMLSLPWVLRGMFLLRAGSALSGCRRRPPLLPLNEAAEADRAARVAGQFGAVFPGVVQYTTDVLFRDLWLRPDLAPRDRSLVTISALVANGQVAQLTGHIPIGMNNGLKQGEIAEAVTHLAFYVGWPNVFSAMPVAKDIFEKRAR